MPPPAPPRLGPACARALRCSGALMLAVLLTQLAACVPGSWSLPGTPGGGAASWISPGAAPTRSSARTGARSEFLDPQLAGRLEIGTVEMRRTERGMLRLVVPFHNLGKDRLEVLCKVVFKDRAGGAVPGGETGYQYISLAAGPTRKEFTSRQLESARYEIHVRRYKP